LNVIAEPDRRTAIAIELHHARKPYLQKRCWREIEAQAGQLGMRKLALRPELSQKIGELCGAQVLENPGQGELLGSTNFNEIERTTVG
jgi:hypothetical protein